MTTRIKGFTVVLENDTREDDVQEIVNAILLIKGVSSVISHPVDAMDAIDRERIKRELKQKLFDVLK